MLPRKAGRGSAVQKNTHTHTHTPLPRSGGEADREPNTPIITIIIITVKALQ